MRIVEEIAAERHRQLTIEGWTAEHDDQHGDGEMAVAAACYANPDGCVVDDINEHPGMLQWPWDREWWKPKDRRRDLIRAAALIVAEIERLDRKAKTAKAA